MISLSYLGPCTNQCELIIPLQDVANELSDAFINYQLALRIRKVHQVTDIALIFVPDETDVVRIHLHK